MATLYGNDSNPIIEALIGGVWTDISSRVRGDQKCVISRGRASEQARTTAQRLNLTLDNADAFFSNRAPLSVNYGLIGKNTQIRVRAGGEAADRYLKLPYTEVESEAGAETADKAVLDITGDIDVRAEIMPRTWRPADDMIIASKWNFTNNARSWMFAVDTNGKLTISWTTDGLFATRRTATSTAAIDASSGRLAVRFTLDVNNGAGGVTAAFYTSPSIGGTWTQLGTNVVSATTSSIYSGSANLAVGRGDDYRGANTANRMGFGGRIYEMEVRNGIGGTLVADFSASSQSLGATSWSDGLGTPNTWTLGGTEVGVRVTSDRVRFWGELTNLPQRWDKTGTDVTIPALATGILRRLSQGAKPLDSAMTRNTRRRNPYAWWALEDGSEATSAASGVSGGRALSLESATLGAVSTLPGSKSVLTFSASTSRAYTTTFPVPANTGVLSLVFYMRLTTLPASKSMFAAFTTAGTARRIEIGIASGAWYIDFYDSGGTIVGNQSVAVTPSNDPTAGWVGYNLLLEQNGTGIDYSQRWDQVGVGFGGGVGPVTIASASVRPVNAVNFYASAAANFQTLQLSQVFLSTDSFELSDAGFRDASNAYFGETAVDRQIRLCEEEGVAFEHEGFSSESEAMDYQTMTTFPDLMNECWEADGGVAGEARDALAITYRTRVDMENNNDLEISYPLNLMSEVPQPDDGDQGLLNDVTVRRPSGSMARVQVTEGANSVNSPTATPPGVGVYDTDRTLTVAYDDRLPSVAGWIALVGSWDADRYPLVAFGMHRQQLLSDDVLFGQLMKINLGDTLTLSDMPSWMSPDDVPEVVQGIDETLGRFLWEVRFNCTPGGAYQATPLLGSETYIPRLDATGHTTGGSLDTTATSVSLVTPAGSARWVDSATYPDSFPMDIVIGGEVMELTAVTGTSSPQTGSVTRSINGIVKSHSSGASVRLARPFYIGR